MIPPVGSGASSMRQQFLGCSQDSSISPAGAVEQRCLLEDGPGLHVAGLRQVVG